MITSTLQQLRPVVAFAGGGTGGHLYPALAVLAALRRRCPELRALFFATERGIDERILHNASECEHVKQRLRPLRRGPWHWPGIARSFWSTSRRCREELLESQVSIVIGTGGLASVPAVRQAHQLGIPTALLNPDAVPGRANRFLAPQVDVVFAQWDESVEHLSEHANVEVVGCPIRDEFRSATRETGIQRFELDPAKKTLLVTGASQGARTLNEAILFSRGVLLERSDWQVLHLTGESDFERVESAYADVQTRVRVMPYTDHMAEAVAAADLVASRAGASSLAEITTVGRPAILLPYPFHGDMHQLANARCLVRRGAARIVKDRANQRETGLELSRALERLMDDEGERESMARAAQRLGRACAADDIAVRVLELIQESQPVQRRESVKYSAAISR